MEVRNRIKELRRDVRAGSLLPNPKNWRRHPQEQQSALTEMLERGRPGRCRRSTRDA